MCELCTKFLASEKRFSEDQPRDPDGKFASGVSAAHTGAAKELLDAHITITDHPLRFEHSRAAARAEFGLMAQHTAINTLCKALGAGDYGGKRSTAFDEHGNPYEVKPDSSNAGGTDTGLMTRDNIMEQYASADVPEKPHPVPQEGYKPLGIGYGPLGGQQFPEACAMEFMMGPQGELIESRFSEDQPRDPDGKFAGGGSPKDLKVGDVVKDLFGKSGTVKGWHEGNVQVDVGGTLQYWHPTQFRFIDGELRFDPDQPRDPDGKFASGVLFGVRKADGPMASRNLNGETEWC